MKDPLLTAEDVAERLNVTKDSGLGSFFPKNPIPSRYPCE